MPNGITNAAAATALAAVAPDATARYVGLFTTTPTALDGTGGTEATGAGYARKSHSAWEPVDAGDPDIVARGNNGEVAFDAFTGNLSLVGWGIWDAASGGNLLAFGNLRDGDNNDITRNVVSGDVIKFPDNALLIGIGPDF